MMRTCKQDGVVIVSDRPRDYRIECDSDVRIGGIVVERCVVTTPRCKDLSFKLIDHGADIVSTSQSLLPTAD